jgi:transglutaminase-like putative cysteine protease
MNRYHLVHITEFHYDGPVSESYNELRLRPLSDERQSCQSFRLTTQPASQPRAYQDGFGNWVHTFNVLKEHRHLRIEADAVVLRLDLPEPVAEASLARVDEVQPALHEEFYDYMMESQYVPQLAAIGDLVRTAESECDGSALGFAEAASRLIHERFRYVKGATHVQSSIEDALRLGAGVCQDFAHLLLGIARRRGLPARYVSGYLAARRTQRPSGTVEEVIGGQATHAWVDVYIPDCGWMALDPTLGASVGDRHVRLATGRDYGDVAPVRGLYKGHAGQRLSVDVQLRPEVDDEGREQMNRLTAAPEEEEIPAVRPSQPMQQPHQQQQQQQ